eukprot:COSAG05_NODE_19140_length_297_cov_0.681818_1_plen_28_part_10
MYVITNTDDAAIESARNAGCEVAFSADK